MTKEEKHCHIVPFLPFVCRFANMAQSVSQGMVLKIGLDPRIAWDGSTQLEPDNVVMNNNLPLELDAPTTYTQPTFTTLKPPIQKQTLILPPQMLSAHTDIPELHLTLPRPLASISKERIFSLRPQWFLAQPSAPHLGSLSGEPSR